ncbi:hypothetical protein [Micromonospora sp. CB01531]|nr:hypothetical protein [Micromonospora sp. CB01531]
MNQTRRFSPLRTGGDSADNRVTRLDPVPVKSDEPASAANSSI